eukprot:TRINITY_DN5135_c1_g3_i1.p1 TRINITY_DN5135_c1_g3~~TRINITY_DN5135_c1_g3_i1.p1  ORF type:complete len:348 (+),score=67.14 TRINITY_DN5135_c1_g3_i1:593-1636(+)
MHASQYGYSLFSPLSPFSPFSSFSPLFSPSPFLSLLIHHVPVVAQPDDGKEVRKRTHSLSCHNDATTTERLMLSTGAQMLITQAFLCCKLGRDWRLTKSSALPREYVETLRLVSDHPDAPFSIHKIALQGKCLGKEVGQWFGPSTAINAVQQLHAIHQRTAFNMFIADDGVVYLDQLRRAARSPQDPDADTFSPVLLMIPVRVGLDRLNPLYLSAIRECFHYRQSLGIIGGRPRASLYFVASQGNTLLYLDPHVVQPAVNMGKKRFDHSSYHCKALKRINIVDADPSMAIAFLIHTQQDLDEFAARTFEICGQSDSYVFSVCKETPDHKSVLCDFEDDADLDDFVAL